MLESAAKLLQCPDARPTLCVGVACIAWVAEQSVLEKWVVVRGTSDEALLPTAQSGASATVTRPGEGSAKLWEFAYTHADNSLYDLWTHAPTIAASGYCGRSGNE